MRRSLFVLALVVALGSSAGIAAAAWQAQGIGSGTAKAKPDWRAPAVTAATVAQASAPTPGFVAAGATYHVYANISDTGNPSSGVVEAAADVSALTAGATLVTLTPCASGCAAGGTTYAYKSASITADSALAEGRKSYSVSATDAAGNTVREAGFSVSVDNTPPTTTASLAPAANARGWNNTAVTVNLRADDAGGSGAATITYGASGARSIPSTTVTGSSTAFAIDAEGTTAVSFGARDNVGNEERAGTRTIKIDTSTPRIVASALVNTATGAAGIVRQGGGYTIYANADDAVSGIGEVAADVRALTAGATAIALTPCASGCTVDGTTYAYKSVVQTADSQLAEGSKSYSVAATDNAGNTAAREGGFAAVVDNTPPTVTLTTPASGSATNNPRPTFGGAAGTATDDASIVTLEIRAGAPASGGAVVETVTATAAGDSWSASTTTSLGEGVYTAQARQADRAGNTGATLASTFTIDMTPPAAPTSVSLANGGGQGSAYINGSNSATVSVSVSLPSTSTAADAVTVTLSDGTRSVAKTVTATGGAETLLVSGIDTSALADGTIALATTSADRAGNVSPSTGSTSPKDTVAPGLPTASYVDNKNPAADAIRGTAEPGSTVTALQTAPTTSGPYTATASSTGSYVVTVGAAKGVTVTYAVTADDAAGNTSSAATLTAAATR